MKNVNPQYNNSAGRLLAVLDELNKNNNGYIVAIPLIFGDDAPKKDKGKTEPQRQTFVGISHLHYLYSQFIEEMRSSDIPDQQRQVLMNGLKELELIVYPSNLGSAARKITEAEKSLLEVCATIIPQEENLSNDYISEIRESINSLRNLIEKSDTPAQLKSLLLEFMRLSNDSIDRFNIYGAKGLKSSIKSMLAEVAELQLSMDEKEIEKIQKSGSWDTMLKHLRVVDGIASKMLKYKPLLEGAGKLFLGN